MPLLLGFSWDLSCCSEYQHPWPVVAVLCKEDHSLNDDQTPDFQPSASLSQQGPVPIGTAVDSWKWSKNRAEGLWWEETYRHKCLFLFLCFYSSPATASISNPVFKKNTKQTPESQYLFFRLPLPCCSSLNLMLLKGEWLTIYWKRS